MFEILATFSASPITIIFYKLKKINHTAKLYGSVSSLYHKCSLAILKNYFKIIGYYHYFFSKSFLKEDLESLGVITYIFCKFFFYNNHILRTAVFEYCGFPSQRFKSCLPEGKHFLIVPGMIYCYISYNLL